MRHVSGPAILLVAGLLAAACGDGGVGPGRPQSRIDILPDSAPTATLHVGDTIRLMARRLDADGAPLPSDAARFVWSTGNPSVAVIDPDGLTRIVGTGLVAITARVAGASTPGVASTTDTASASVTLQGTPLTIEILPESLAATEYFLGDTVRLHARRVDAAGTPLPDDTTSFVWESSDTTAVAIDAAGLVYFEGLGTSTIRARIADANNPEEPSAIDTLSATIELGRLPVVVHAGPVQAGVRMQWGGSPFCVVLADGGLSCRNSAGDWVARGGDLRFTSISTSSEHSCALATDARAFCWGRNDNGQLGQGFTRGFVDAGGVATELVEVGGGHRWLSIDAGGHAQTCGITTNQVPLCVGHNDFGQVGREPRVASDSVLAEWGSGFRVTSLRTEQFETCGIAVGGHLHCSGYITGAPGIPRRIAGPEVFTTVAVGSQHACALDPAGAAFCAGLNQSGQLGAGDLTYGPEFRPVLGGLTFTDIYANWHTTCGVTDVGETWCWGFNDGTLGRARHQFTAVPIKVGVGLGMHSIEQACGIDAQSRFVCWGAAEVLPRTAAARMRAEIGTRGHP